MKKNFGLSSDQGLSIIEVLLALVLFGSFSFAWIHLTLLSKELRHYTQSKQRALNIAERKIEFLKNPAVLKKSACNPAGNDFHENRGGQWLVVLSFNLDSQVLFKGTQARLAEENNCLTPELEKLRQNMDPKYAAFFGWDDEMNLLNRSDFLLPGKKPRFVFLKVIYGDEKKNFFRIIRRYTIIP